ncbi:TIR domain-containing protein [Flavobacterium sp. UBA7682]|uniref:TIR domain-containing protein n=1 Tax=Flavobacterium sp. UBA7682 TaxID=1946560 RepID=UPI0025BA7811|nr:TIR domain-containing protein [Flavobacterium sp. UBA7682]
MSHLYISYDQADGYQYAKKLHESLESGLPKFSTWLLDIHLTESEDSFSEANEAMQTCKCFILIISNNSTSTNSRCKQELKKAIEYKKPIIAVQYISNINLLPRLLNRKCFLSFGSDKSDEIKQHLNQIDSFEQKLNTLKEYLKDAENDLLYTNGENKPRVESEITVLNEQIKSLQQYLNNKDETAKLTEERIMLSIERERRPERTNATSAPTYKVINNPPTIAPSYFQDRIIETDLAVNFLQSESIKIISIIGRGGVGKTAMVCRLLKSLERGILPDDSKGIDLSGIIYMTEIGSRPISFPNLFADLSLLVEENKRESLMQLQENSQSTVISKLNTLLELIPSKPIVILLDNFEDKIDSETRNIKDTELKEAIVHLLKMTNHAIKFIITTRILPIDFNFIEPGRQRIIDLNEGLESPYAENVLRELDGDGHLGLKNADEGLLNKIKEITRGFPRALEAFYAILCADRSTSINDLLNTLLPTDTLTQTLVGEAYNRLSETDQKIMQALAIYGFPILPSGIDYLLRSFIPNIDSSVALKRLVNMHFVRMDGREFYLHPLDREYALSRIPSMYTSGENSDYFKKQLFTIAAEYMEEIALPRDEWKTLSDITPQIRQFYLLAESENSFDAKYVLKDLSNFIERKGGFGLNLEMAEKLEQIALDSDTKRAAIELQANAYWRKGDLDEAVKRQKKILKFIEENDNDHEKLRLKGNLLIMENELKTPQENLDSFSQLLNELETKYPWYYQNIAVIHDNLAMNYKRLGYYDKAISHSKEALELSLKHEDLDSIEAQNHNYGSKVKAVDRKLAVEYFQKALDLSEQSGNPLWKANHLAALSGCYFDDGKTEEAIDYIKMALLIRKEIVDLGGEANDSVSLASYLLHQGKINEALILCQTALSQAKELGLNLSGYYMILSEILLSERQLEKSLEYINDSISTNKSASYGRYNLAGLIWLLLNNKSESKKYFEKALNEANIYIDRCDKNAGAFTSKGFAFAGLFKLNIDYEQNKIKAITAYKQARKLDSGKGIIQQRLKFFDYLGIKDDYPNIFESITGKVFEAKKNMDSIQSIEEPKTKPLKAFISYSKYDGESCEDNINYLKEFKTTLAPLSNRFNNLIETWDDTCLIAGDQWDDEIKNQLNSCDIIFLLVSSHFLDTPYIVNVELSNAIERHEKKECIVVPIVIKACGWKDIPILKKINGIPRKGGNISAWKNNRSWTSRDDAWYHAYQEISKLITKFKNEKQ